MRCLRSLTVLALCVWLLVYAPPRAMASWSVTGIEYGASLGYAVFTPNTETTLSSTPDEGVSLPANTVTIVITVEDNPIRYFFGSTAVTATRGNLLYAGTYTLTNDYRLIAALRFIDSASGPAKVTVQFLGRTR